MGIITFDAKPVFAKTEWYVYVDELPEFGSYASNVVNESTKYWQNIIPELNFHKVDDPIQANLHIQWVKEFGVEHVGYAYGSQFIEVGLGDSNCNDSWTPFSANYVAHIMKHEIGHVLGYKHTSDPNDIMYPVAINYEYGIVEQDLKFVENYAYFVPVCTAKPVTSFNYHVSTDDPEYGFDVYFVPNDKALSQWAGGGGTFEYYESHGCSAQNHLSYDGMCKDVSGKSGLLIFTHDTLTNPLTTITVSYSESLAINNSGNTDLPRSDIVDKGDFNISDSFEIFADPKQRYTIQYPSTWLVAEPTVKNYQASFYDKEDYQSVIHVLLYENVDHSSYSNDQILDAIVKAEQEYCKSLTYSLDGQICYNFQIVTDTSNKDSDAAYHVGYTSTRQYSDPAYKGQYTVKTTVSEIHEDGDTWTVVTESRSKAFEKYSSLLQTSVESFSLVKKSSSGDDTRVEPTPVPQESKVISDGAELKTDIGSVYIQQDVYDIGNADTVDVRISGNIHSKTQDKITLTYTFPDGSTNGNLVSPTKEGNFESVLTLDKDSPSGTYEVFVSVSKKILGIVRFEVVDGQKEQQPATLVPIPVKSQFADFVDPKLDPYSYIDRYDTEEKYRKWFDNNFPEYTIYEAVGIKEPLSFVDPEKTQQYYIDRYDTEEKYRKWFDNNFPEYTIYEAVGIREPVSQVPDWVKTNAKLWSEGLVDDHTFVSSIQYLIKEKIILIPELDVSLDNAGNSSIPSWVKSNAQLWHQGILDDESFLNGIKFMVENGIITFG